MKQGQLREGEISASQAQLILGVDSTKLSEFVRLGKVVKLGYGRYLRSSVEEYDRELTERREIARRSPVIWLEGGYVGGRRQNKPGAGRPKKSSCWGL